MQERVVRVIRSLRVMWRGLETGISYGSPRQSSTLPNSSSDTPVSAWVKSEELVTANGPYLSVSDAYDHNTYATTKKTVGTTVWHRVEHEFQTGPVAKLVVIHFVHDPGSTLIHGRFWVEEVSLRPAVQPTSVG